MWRDTFASQFSLQELSFAPVINWFRFRILDQTGPRDMVARLEATGLVGDASVNAIGHVAFIPNDPFWGEQWYLPKVQMPAAWDRAGGGSTRYLSVVDTGVQKAHSAAQVGAQSNHEDLGFIYGWNFVTGLGDNWDGCNHGTTVAGVAAAFTNNNIGIAGTNYAAPILSARITSHSACLTVVASAAAEAIRYSVDNGASAITASWAIPATRADVPSLEAAVSYAWNNNVVLVAASGNDNHSNFNDLVPARWATVVTVGGTKRTDVRWSEVIEGVTYGANYGSPGLDVSAPADDIRTTNWYFTGNNQIPKYAVYDGTSLAVPIVAGTIGLMKQVQPGITSREIKDAIDLTADEVGGYSYSWGTACGGQSSQLGCGRLNAFDAVVYSDNLR